ncbi:uncharacterized protein N7503_009961 [Penicillium pulvis]|uniref:uncharacterized protein n=1 Tax=Penicillium pulvis TaxID=1562058 RepID=UPI00254916F0|nr:uncharacterized protein N7503_009961 [Penicillium pulvis]KAJ5784749.1 hypothetical protein N7503_009961 [Penicillium pulvis]
MFIRTFLDACHSLDFVEPRTDAKSYLWAEISVVTQASEGHDSFITEVQEVGRTKLRIISHSDQPSKALRGLCSDEASDHEPVTGESIPRHHPSEQPSLMPCAPKGIATSYDTIVPVARRPEMSSQWAASFLTAITDHDTLGEEGPKESLVQKSSAATMLNPGQITSVTRFLEEVPPQRHTLDFTFGKLCLLWSDCVGYCLPRTFHIHHSLYNKLGLSRIQPLLGKRYVPSQFSIHDVLITLQNSKVCPWKRGGDFRHDSLDDFASFLKGVCQSDPLQQ